MRRSSTTPHLYRPIDEWILTEFVERISSDIGQRRLGENDVRVVRGQHVEGEADSVADGPAAADRVQRDELLVNALLIHNGGVIAILAQLWHGEKWDSFG